MAPRRNGSPPTEHSTERPSWAVRPGGRLVPPVSGRSTLPNTLSAGSSPSPSVLGSAVGHAGMGHAWRRHTWWASPGDHRGRSPARRPARRNGHCVAICSPSNVFAHKSEVRVRPQRPFAVSSTGEKSKFPVRRRWVGGSLSGVWSCSATTRIQRPRRERGCP